MAVEGWREVSLSAVATGITKGTTPTTFGYDYQPEGINFFRVENITLDGKLSLRDLKYIDDVAHNALLRSQLKNDDILVSIAGALGRSAIVRQDHLPANINQAIAIVRLTDASVDHDFIRHAISGPLVQAQIKNVQAGLAQSNLNLQQVGELKIELPALPEQKKIAEILGSVDEAIAKTEAVISQTQKVKQGLLQTLLTKGIGHTKFKQTEIGEIPESWEVKNLKELSIKITDGTHHSPETTDTGYLYITSKNIRPLKLIIEKPVYISEEDHREIYSRCDVKKGDVLLTKDGANTGNCTINPLDEQFSLLSSVGLIRTNPSKLSNQFLCQFLNSEPGRSQSIGLMDGQAIKRITIEKIKNFKIPTPPLLEQNKICKVLTSYDVVIEHEETRLESLFRLKKGLMSDLLTGRVRVKLDKKSEKAA